MANGFDSYTRYTAFGFGWSNLFSTVFDFRGILELEISAGGVLKAMWEEDIDAVYYNIYVRADNFDIFHSTYLLGKFPNPSSGVNYEGDPILFANFRTEADANILLQDTKMYYVGVRAENEYGVEDSNESYLYVRPLGTGQAYVFVNDRHISVVS